jgi:hypothetical protein
MRSSRIKQNSCGHGVDKEHTQHDVGVLLGFFSVEVVQMSLSSSRGGILGGSLLSSCSTSLALVGSWRIGARCSISPIGTLTGEVSWLATGVAATSLRASVGVVAGVGVVSSNTRCSRLAVVVGVGRARCRWWGPLRLGCWSW